MKTNEVGSEVQHIPPDLNLSVVAAPNARSASKEMPSASEVFPARTQKSKSVQDT